MASDPLEHPEIVALVERSHRLGSDRRVTNFGGGNTSAKLELADPVTGEPDRARGEGLGRRPRHPDRRRPRRSRPRPAPRAGARLRGASTTRTTSSRSTTHAASAPAARPRRSTRRCTRFLDADHVDHTHPDAVIALRRRRRRRAPRGRRLRRPTSAGSTGNGRGSTSGSRCATSRGAARSSSASLLGGHGAHLLGGRPATSARRLSLELIAQAERLPRRARPAGAARSRGARVGLPPAERRGERRRASARSSAGIAVERPAGRRALRPTPHVVLDFLAREAAPRLARARHLVPRPLPPHEGPAAAARPPRRRAPFEERVARLRELHAAVPRPTTRALLRRARHAGLAADARRRPGDRAPPRRRDVELRRRRADGARRRRVLRQRDQRDARRRGGVDLRSRSTTPRSSASSTGSSRRRSSGCARTAPPLAGPRRARHRRRVRASGARSPSDSPPKARASSSPTSTSDARREGRRRPRATERALAVAVDVTDEAAVDGGVRRRGARASAASTSSSTTPVSRSSAPLVDTDGRRLGPAPRRARPRLVPRQPRPRPRDDGEQGVGGDIVYVVSKNAVVGRPEERRLRRGQGRPGPPGPPARRRARPARHPRQRREPRRRRRGLGHLRRRVARGARRGLRRRARGARATSTPSAPCSGQRCCPSTCRRRRRRARRRRRFRAPPASSSPSTAASPPPSCDDPEAAMAIRITHADQIATLEADRLVAPRTRPRPRSATRLGRPGVDADAVIAEVRALLGRGSVVGGGHRRHPLRPLPASAASRAPPRRSSTTSPRSTRSPAPTARSACTCRGTTRDDPAALRAYADGARHRLRRDELEHVPGQPVHHRRRRVSYKFGSLGQRRRRRAQARARAQPRTSSSSACSSARPRSPSGSADGTNHPGPGELPRASSSASPTACASSTTRCPADWQLFTEHKPYEPAFYSTRRTPTGARRCCSRRRAGERAQCLVDLGHHLPEHEHRAGRQRGSRWPAGSAASTSTTRSTATTTSPSARSTRTSSSSILLELRRRTAAARCPPSRYMIDASHNLKDPIEDLIQATDEIQLTLAQALLRRPRRRSRRRRTATTRRSPPRCCRPRTAPTCGRSSPRRAGATARALDPLATFRRSRLPRRRSSGRAARGTSPPACRRARRGRRLRRDVGPRCGRRARRRAAASSRSSTGGSTARRRAGRLGAVGLGRAARERPRSGSTARSRRARSPRSASTPGGRLRPARRAGAAALRPALLPEPAHRRLARVVARSLGEAELYRRTGVQLHADQHDLPARRPRPRRARARARGC